MCAIKKGVAKKSVTVYCLPAVESSSAGSRIGSGSFACVDDESRNGQLVSRRGQEGVRSAYYELKFLQQDFGSFSGSILCVQSSWCDSADVRNDLTISG